MNHTHIEAAPGASAAFRREPAAESLDTFLHVNAGELGSNARQEVSAAIAALVRDYLAPVCLSACPEHLQDALRRLVTQAAYEVRNAGKKVDPQAEHMPTQGTAKSSILNPCRR